MVQGIVGYDNGLKAASARVSERQELQESQLKLNRLYFSRERIKGKRNKPTWRFCFQRNSQASAASPSCSHQVKDKSSRQ